MDQALGQSGAEITHALPAMRSVAVRLARYWLALIPLVFVLVLLVAPALRLLLEGEQGGWTWLTLVQPWQDPYLRWRVQWSLLQAALTCVLVLLVGLPIAWVLARFEFAGRRWVLRGLMLPFVVPTLVAALGVLALLGPSGLLSHLGGADLQGTPWLLLYGNVFFNLCVVVRAATDALGRVSAAQLAAARTLGCTPWRVFWRIELPAIAPWLMSALCLVFLYCFAGFGLALVLGGQDYATLEVEIYTLVAYELALDQAGVLALWSLVLTAMVVLLYVRVEHHLATPARADVVPRTPPQGAVQYLALGLALAVLFALCGAPLLAIGWRAAQAGTQAWAVLRDADTLDALWNTLRFSALALVLATGLGLAHALAARRVVVLRALAFLPFVVSPVLVAFGLLLLYPAWTASMALLVAAYALLAYPFVAKSLAAALDSLPAHYADAARTLGASPWRSFYRVTLPLLAPALRRGMAFAAATVVGEFAVSLFLSRPEWATLSTLIYQYLSRPGAANLDSALVLACLLMALALAAFVAIDEPSYA